MQTFCQLPVHTLEAPDAVKELAWQWQCKRDVITHVKLRELRRQGAEVALPRQCVARSLPCTPFGSPACSILAVHAAISVTWLRPVQATCCLPASYHPPCLLLITLQTSFIRYLLGRDYPGAHVGPEPTTDRFVVVHQVRSAASHFPHASYVAAMTERRIRHTPFACACIPLGI